MLRFGPIQTPLFAAEQLCPDRRMDAIGADQHVARSRTPVRQRDGHPIGILLKSVDVRVQAVAVLADAAEQHVKQVRAMGVIIRRTEMHLCARSERRVVKALAGIPCPVVAALREDRDARQRAAESEHLENARGVGTELDPGADLGEGLSLLEQLRRDPTLA
jgi:hypothetical protein